MKCDTSAISINLDLSKKPKAKAGVPFADHYCLVAGCPHWGAFGIGRDLFFCGEHLAEAKAMKSKQWKGTPLAEHLLPQPNKDRKRRRERALQKDQGALL